MMTGAKSSTLVHFRIMATSREQRRAYFRLDTLGMESCEVGINRLTAGESHTVTIPDT
jgi:hypothetical protein